MISNKSRLLVRYSQFCLVGGSGVLVDMVIVWLLASPAMMGLNLTLSKVIAGEVAIFNNFLWNDRWTFRGLALTTWRARLRRLGKFNLICVAGVALSALLLNIEVYWFDMNLYLANLVSIVAVSFWNFLMNVKFGWHGRSEPKSRSEESATSMRLG